MEYQQYVSFYQKIGQRLSVNISGEITVKTTCILN